MQDKLYVNDCIMLHKCMHGPNAPQYLSNKFKRRNEVQKRTTRQSQDLNIPTFRLATGQRSFEYRGTKIWNTIPKDIANIGNLKTFKKQLIKQITSQ